MISQLPYSYNGSHTEDYHLKDNRTEHQDDVLQLLLDLAS